MREHVEETIRDLSGEIARLQDAVKVLQGLQGLGTMVGARPHPGPLPQEREGVRQPASNPCRVMSVATAKRLNGAALGKKRGALAGSDGVPRGENSAMVRAAAAWLAEPWSKLDLQTATGRPKAAIASYVDRWVKWGWVAKVGFGKYERTAKWGGAETGEGALAPVAPAATKSPMANGQSPRSAGRKGGRDLRAEMEQALRDRDRENANGNELLAAEHQERIDRLEAAMGE